MVSGQPSRERRQEPDRCRFQPGVQGRILLPADQRVEGADNLACLDECGDGCLDGATVTVCVRESVSRAMVINRATLRADGTRGSPSMVTCSARR